MSNKIQSRGLSDRAKKFGVNQPAIFYALKRMKITREKINSLQRKKQRRKDKILSETTKFYQKIWK